MLSRWLIIVLSVPVLIVASQGYSILYLFLLADLLCCAAAFPVFFGFYSARYQSYNAALSTAGGLVAGLIMFPPRRGHPHHQLAGVVSAGHFNTSSDIADAAIATK